MIVRRKSWKRLGAALSSFALLLQLALASWGLPPPRLAIGPTARFDPHALCLAGGGPAPTPARETPASPAHDHGADCCLWHAVPAVQPGAVSLPTPIAYASATPTRPMAAGLAPGRSYRPANARAPPTLT